MSWVLGTRKKLEPIAKRLEVVDRAPLDSGQSVAMGAFDRVTRVFQGRLAEVPVEIGDGISAEPG